MNKTTLATLALSTAAILTSCASPQAAPPVADSIRQSLKTSGLNDVTVSEDRTKGVVTLGGHVPSDDGKFRAEEIAKSTARNEVVANEIAVLPAGDEKDAKNINSDLDKGIEKNLDAALIQSRMEKNVKYSVKNGVVTLTGELNTQARRDQAARVSAAVPNVAQVVNEIQVKNQPATSTR